jgi:hypothetical protein
MIPVKVRKVGKIPNRGTLISTTIVLEEYIRKQQSFNSPWRDAQYYFLLTSATLEYRTHLTVRRARETSIGIQSTNPTPHPMSSDNSFNDERKSIGGCLQHMIQLGGMLLGLFPALASSAMVLPD